MHRVALSLLSVSLWLGATGSASAAPSEAAQPSASLVTAVETGDRTTAIAMIKSHADVRLRDADGTTALHWAAHESDTELAQLLDCCRRGCACRE